MKISNIQIVAAIILICLSNVFTKRNFLKSVAPGIADNLKLFLGFFSASALKEKVEFKPECADASKSKSIEKMKASMDLAKKEGNKSLKMVVEAYSKTGAKFKTKLAKCMKAYGVVGLEESLAVLESADLDPFLKAFGSKKGDKVKAMTVSNFIRKGERKFTKAKAKVDALLN